MTSNDVFSRVTVQILALLEAGIIPWRRPWSTGAPLSYVSNKEYQGINVFLLQSSYESPYWMTYRQAQAQGGYVRAGEHGRLIVFVDKSVRMIKDKETEEERPRVYTFLKTYIVFNYEQCENLPEKKAIERQNLKVNDAEALLRMRNPVIRYHPGSCFFEPNQDAIYTPGIDQFDSIEDYYSSNFHELTHWTGGARRLARFNITDYCLDRQVRSLEELTAEMGAAFMSQLANLDTSATIKNSGAYIQHWLQPLRDNPSWVLKASKRAREAVDYILTGKVSERSQAAGIAAA